MIIGNVLFLMLKVGIFFGGIEHFGLISPKSIEGGAKYVCVDTDYAEQHTENYIHKLDDVVYYFSNIFRYKINNRKYRSLRVPFTDPALGRDEAERALPKYKPGFQSLSGSLYTDGFCEGDEKLLKKLTKFDSFHNIIFPLFSDMEIVEITTNSGIQKSKNIFFPEVYRGYGDTKYGTIIYKKKTYPIMFKYIDFSKYSKKNNESLESKLGLGTDFAYFYPVSNSVQYTNNPNGFSIYAPGKYIFNMVIKDSINLHPDLQTYFQFVPIKTIIMKYSL